MLMFSSLIQEMSTSLIFFDDLESFQIFYPYKFQLKMYMFFEHDCLFACMHLSSPPFHALLNFTHNEETMKGCKCSALMDIKQREVLQCVTTTTTQEIRFQFHFRGIGTFTFVAISLTVKLLLTLLMTQICRNRDSSIRPFTCFHLCRRHRFGSLRMLVQFHNQIRLTVLYQEGASTYYEIQLSYKIYIV